MALPAEAEEIDPAFSHHDRADLPEADDDGTRVRVLVGEAFGLRSPVPTHSPTLYVHAELKAGASVEVPAPYSERAAYVVRGRVRDADGAEYTARQLLLFGNRGTPVLRAAEDSTVMLLGGESVGERYLWWNFVSSRQERIQQAAAD